MAKNIQEFVSKQTIEYIKTNKSLKFTVETHYIYGRLLGGGGFAGFPITLTILIHIEGISNAKIRIEDSFALSFDDNGDIQFLAGDIILNLGFVDHYSAEQFWNVINNQSKHLLTGSIYKQDFLFFKVGIESNMDIKSEILNINTYETSDYNTTNDLKELQIGDLHIIIDDNNRDAVTSLLHDYLKAITDFYNTSIDYYNKHIDLIKPRPLQHI